MEGRAGQIGEVRARLGMEGAAEEVQQYLGEEREVGLREAHMAGAEGAGRQVEGQARAGGSGGRKGKRGGRKGTACAKMPTRHMRKHQCRPP
eukprot:218281-Chlamydomonas_euryale.AAC.1